MNKLILIVGSLALFALAGHMMMSNEKTISPEMSQFNDFKAKFGKKYTSEEEESYRFTIFSENLVKIAQHNASGSTYTMGITEFADMSQSEFKSLYIGQKMDKSKMSQKPPKITELHAGNLQQANINWVTAGKVGPVNNQGQCGSCWSFSAAESIQSSWAVTKNILPQLSEEQLVQCSGSYGNEGCNGGWPYQAFEYVMANKITTSANYPYTSGTGITGRCNAAKAATANYTISSYETVGATCGAVQTALALQPLSVCVDAANWSALYTGGIYPASECGDQIDHAVLLVGSTSTYWLVQNSWGASWGMNGYIELAYGNTCDVCSTVTYPVV